MFALAGLVCCVVKGSSIGRQFFVLQDTKMYIMADQPECAASHLQCSAKKPLAVTRRPRLCTGCAALYLRFATTQNKLLFSSHTEAQRLREHAAAYLHCKANKLCPFIIHIHTGYTRGGLFVLHLQHTTPISSPSVPHAASTIAQSVPQPICNPS
jgi:hypothetical protein